MPRDDVSSQVPSSSSAQSARKSGSNSIFATPAPIRQLFSHFPLLTYPANSLPLRSPLARNQHDLYIFTTPEEAENGAPSFNPGCLKWQTYLKTSGFHFRTVASNNHASPSGALPFLIPSSNSSAKDPVVASRLHTWLSGQEQAVIDPMDNRCEAYMALIDQRIRPAWLYSMYLTSNFDSIATPLYILPATSSSVIRTALARALKQAAENELLKTTVVIDAKSLMKDAGEAFEALEMLLADNEWFSRGKKPSLLDAAVFAYTHLLLNQGLGRGWSERGLQRVVMSRAKLIRHRNRLLEMYY